MGFLSPLLRLTRRLVQQSARHLCTFLPIWIHGLLPVSMSRERRRQNGGKATRRTVSTEPSTTSSVTSNVICRSVQEKVQGVQDVCGEIKEAAQGVDCQGCVKSTFSVQNIKSKFPILKWLPQYRCPQFQGDAIAGLTVGLTVIPQGLAYAQIAELPPQYGLYSAFMGCFVYCLFGTSKDITLGPTAIMSLMTAAFAQTPVKHNATYAIILSFTSGCFQLLMGILSLGFLVDFIPYPVINSFTTSAAITIAVGQIKKWLGLHHISREFIHQVIETCEKIPETNLYDFALGLVCMILLGLMKKLKEVKFTGPNGTPPPMGKMIIGKVLWLTGTARNAIIVIVAAGFTAILLQFDIDVFSVTGDITPGLPDFAFPNFTLVNGNETITTGQIFGHIGSGLIIIPLMCVVESIAIGNAFARKNNYKIDANQELVAIGFSNIFGSFVSAYPVTGSFSRTAVNSQSGVKTPAGGIFTGVLVIVALALLTRWFFFIPQAALAGVIIMAVLDMVSFQLIPKLWRSKKSDLIPWFVTFFLSFILGIEYGILAGIGISLLMLMYPWARPEIQVVSERDYTDNAQQSGEPSGKKEVILMRLKQGIRYPGIEYIKSKILVFPFDNENPRSVVLDCSHMANIDFTVVQGFAGLVADFKLKDTRLVLANVQPDALEALESASIPGLLHCKTVPEAIRLALEEKDSEENVGEALLSPSSSPPVEDDPPPYPSEKTSEKNNESPPTPRTNGAAAKLEDQISVNIDDSDDSASRA